MAQCAIHPGIPTHAKLQIVLQFGLMLLFAGAAYGDILVTNYSTGYVELWNDDGTVINQHFINVGGSTEGLQCVKLSSNEIYVANHVNNHIQVFYLTGPMAGQPVPGADFYIAHGTMPSGTMSALAIDVDGTVLYAADDTNRGLWAVDLPGGGNDCPPSNACFVNTAASHDVIVGPGGKVYATNYGQQSSVIQFSPHLPNAGIWTPTVLTFVATGNYSGHPFFGPGGMVFDGGGNLWVTNIDYPSFTNDGIFEFTGPQNPNPAQFLNFTADTNNFPLGLDVSPVNPPGPPLDSCKGCIVVANFKGGTVSQIDPSQCTNGVCSLQSFFAPGGEPKYVRFTENCCDSGYLEICKTSCTYNPVTGNFNFQATNEEQTVHVTVPVNACSGPIQIPSGTIHIHETQPSGVVLNDVIAYDYDYLGNQTNALLAENLPFTYGNVNVVSGDISTETVAGFTNCASGPGELKICKVAGSGALLNDPFKFTTTVLLGRPAGYTVPAGPPPGGYCEVAGTYPAGTMVIVTENPKQYNATVSNISVAPADRQGVTTANSVTVEIASGTTEVTFTNVLADGGRTPH